MADPQPSPEQVQALDTLIEAMERGEISPREVATGIKAPPPVNVQGGGGGITQVTVSLTVTLATVFTLVAGAEESDEARTVQDLPDEITLEDLLAVRRRLAGT
jgi:hypothetical protein